MNLRDIKRNCKGKYFEVDQVTASGRGMNCKYEDARTEVIDGMHHVSPIGVSNMTVYIICPHCGQIHWHGICNGEYQGHRQAHCIDIKSSGYIIKRI